MPRKQGDPCPHCQDGKLSLHPDRMIADGASHRTWLCDTCKKICKDHFIELLETVEVSDHITTILEGKRTIKNYYALVLGVIITSIAIYTFSIDSIFSVNAIITAFLGLLDTIAFYYFITKFHFKETHS